MAHCPGLLWNKDTPVVAPGDIGDDSSYLKNSLGKILIGKDWGQWEKVVREDEMVGWHHLLNEHEFEQTPGDSEGQGSLVCCSPWGDKESDMTEQLNNNRELPLKEEIAT